VRYEQHDCPVKAALNVIGGKWRPLILYHLFEGTKRYGELSRLVPGITRRILTLQLRELESAGVIRRVIYQEVPPKVEYSMTEFGKSLEPLLQMLNNWGEEFTADCSHIRHDKVLQK
jgi:DNA-binding HxlR family transcriptional regulator